MMSAMLAQTMTQEDVFRSITTSMETGGGGVGWVAWLLLGVVAVLLVVPLVARRKQGGGATVRRLRHPGKLQRELVRKVGLKSGDLKKLKTLAEEVDATSPMLLLLCPSLMAEAARKRRGR